jgi:hypothetical protein
MPQIVVRKKTPKATCYLGRDVVTIKQRIPRLIAYDDTYIAPPVPYIDGGTFANEGAIADAGLYNTSYWEIVWDGGTP